MNKKLLEIKKSIENENISYAEISYLQCHKQEVLNTGDIELAQWAGITEEEWDKGELNPDLSFKEDFIKLDISSDNEYNAICVITIDDGQELAITEYELKGLKKIFTEHYAEMEDYFHDLYEKVKDIYMN